MTDVAAGEAHKQGSSSDHMQSTRDSLKPSLPNTEVDDTGAVDAPEGGSQLSKNQQKKLKRKQQWEEGRERRKKIRKEKTKQKKARKREALEQNGADPSAIRALLAPPSKRNHRPIQAPITFLLDCQFDDLMTENERVSLSGQLTRSYSDNRKATYKAHMAVSSFGGHLKERFEGIMARTHEGWQGVQFFDDDFVAVAEKASRWMRDEETGGKLVGALAGTESEPTEGETVYLTSDSPDTLHRLSPYSTYVIGALVDKNRHKGICYKKAMDRGMRTAKLPIGEFMKMSSRFVLTTNQVVEIMLQWIELGDWGEAFLKVIPKRKGGVLKEATEDIDGSGKVERILLDSASSDDASSDGDDESKEEGPSDVAAAQGRAEAINNDCSGTNEEIKHHESNQYETIERDDS